MKIVKITVLRKADYRDLQSIYELPQEEPCCVSQGQQWYSHNAMMPDGFCPTAWQTLQPFVSQLANNGGRFYGDWMKNPHSALISCNDGFRPVSFLLETVDTES